MSRRTGTCALPRRTHCLDFARARDRVLLENLAERQSGWGAHFDVTDVRQAFSKSGTMPEWHGQFAAPWNFYAPNAIASRQKRWAEEDARRLARDAPNTTPGPHVHAAPKIGRNDACPCGSGKKYKKCCLPTQDL